MTPKQIERVKKKIALIKKELAADKRRWGGYYNDSRGLRYLPPELYIKIEDYTGGLRYFNWFKKTFDDDIGSPIFLFEWIIVLFKTKRIKLAEKKALETFASNFYIIDKFLENGFIDVKLKYRSNWENIEYTQYLEYSKNDDFLKDFTQWLVDYTRSDDYKVFTNKLLEINLKIDQEDVGPKRSALIEQESELIRSLK